MNLMDRLLDLKPTKLFIILFYVLGPLYPFVSNMDLFLFGEKTHGIVTKKSEFNPEIDDLEHNIQFSFIEFGVEGDVYEIESGPYDYDKIGTDVTLFYNPEDPLDYVILSFNYLYLSWSGLFVFLGVFFFSIFLYAHYTEPKTYPRVKIDYIKRHKRGNFVYKSIVGATILLLLSPILIYFLHERLFGVFFIMCWVVLPFFIIQYRLRFSKKAMKKKHQKRKEQMRKNAEHVQRVRAKMNKRRKA